MTSTVDSSCFDFDLNFLRQHGGEILIPNDKYEKQRKSLIFIKKKIKVTDGLINKYTANKDQLHQTEKTLFNSQEENKSIRIEYKTLLDKCTKLELDIQALLTVKHDLEIKYASAENKYEAIQAHAKQLEHLIKEYESRIESLKCESNDEKVKIKRVEKRYSSYQKEYELMKQHMDVVLDAVHTKKLLKMNRKDRLIVEKYMTYFHKKFKEPIFDERDSDKESNMLKSISDAISVELPYKTKEMVLAAIEDKDLQRSCVLKTDDIDMDSDCSHGTSPDTGRGSSLAFSDSDKCIQSPDYNGDSIFTEFVSSSHNYVHVATSPVRKLTIDRTTSPIQFDNNQQLCKYVDQAVSPIKMGVSAATSPIRKSKNGKICRDSEQQCNSNILMAPGSEDLEVAMILDRMRIPRLVSPIPSSPASCGSSSTDCQCCSCRKIIDIKKELARFCKQMLAKTQNTHLEPLLKETLNINQDLEHESIFEEENKTITNDNGQLESVIEEENRNMSNNSGIRVCIGTDNATDIEELDDPIRICNPQGLDQNDESTQDLVIDCDDTGFHDNRHDEYSRHSDEDDPITISNISPNSESSPKTRSKLQFEEDCVENTPVKEKPKKLTKLQRFKNKMLPRSKINKETKPLKKINSKLRLLPPRSAKKLNSCHSAMTLNDKKVYENAVKVMKRLNAEKLQKEKTTSHVIEKQNNNITDKQTIKASSNKTDSVNKRLLRSSTKMIEPNDSQNKVIQGIDDLKLSSCESMPKENNVTSQKSNPADCENLNKTENIKQMPDVRINKIQEECRKIKRLSTEESDIHSKKRILRSSMNNSLTDKNMTKVMQEKSRLNNDIVESEVTLTKEKQSHQEKNNCRPQESVLCEMIKIYGITGNKYPKKIPDSSVDTVYKDIEENINKILEMQTNDAKEGMNKLAESLQRFTLRQFVVGLIKYLSDSERRSELFNKIKIPAGPAMTKTEQILLYVVLKLKDNWPEENAMNYLLRNIEYTLFRLNCTPEFNVIESLSHFYAVICRYMKAKSRLRIFILDAMYTMNFKAIPLIKQCLDVWMHILPLAHMSIAKTPLVTCLVYLLHYFKCVDRFNRVQEIRRMLQHMYFYKITEWTEPKILELLKHAIIDVKGNATECKMLRLAIIILAKRHGPQWCQKNIFKNILQPIIEDQQTSEPVKVFCISVVGPLIKPYPLEMKVHCEIWINQLIDMLDQNPSFKIQEAIYTSLVFAAKHNQNKVIQTLLRWHHKDISPEMEAVLRDYVKEKSLRAWKTVLSKLMLNR